MSDNIKMWITEWFKNNVGIKEEDIVAGISENYFDAGWIDSFKFISFIQDIEQNYEIRFNNDEFQNKTFTTIKGLSSLIKEKIK